MFLLPATLRFKLTIKRLTRSPPATVKWCLKNVLSGKRLSGKRLVRETSVRESDCPGNDRTPPLAHLYEIQIFARYFSSIVNFAAL